MSIFSEVGIQRLLHEMEQGKIAPYIRGGMISALVVALLLLYLFVHFNGFGTSEAMDQAQIARNMAKGEGFSTKYIRPLAIRELEKSGREIPAGVFPDFSNMPLNPALNSVVLQLVRSNWKMTSSDLVYVGDRIIATVSILLFLLSLGFWFLVASQLFDQRLGFVAVTAILVTDLLWKFSLSGLPQMLMLLIFSAASYCIVKALYAREEENTLGVAIFLLIAGVLFGLLTLAHGLAAWMFLGFLLFALVHFRPRGLVALVALAGFLIVVSPWLVRNFQVCGNPAGIGLYEALYPGSTPTDSVLRIAEGVVPGEGSLLNKARTGVIRQIQGLFGYLGLNFLAPLFFVSLIHPFKRTETFALRWGILLMWLATLAGMAFFQPSNDVSANQLHVLFLPLFVIYGLAFLLVLWHRLGIDTALLRTVFLTAAIVTAGIPMLITIIGGPGLRVQWPPYIPPFIAVYNDWFRQDEIMCSDMPWAVAWYADRKCLLMPNSLESFNRITDYRTLGRQISGLYLTPLTLNRPLVSDIYKGTLREWAPVILRPPNTRGFPLTYYTALPIDGECIIFSDRDRWSRGQN